MKLQKKKASLGFYFNGFEFDDSIMVVKLPSLILAVLLILSIFVFRPFCSYLCPLGAFYGLFNPIAFYRMQIDEKLCIKCGTCKSVCKFSIPVYDVPNSKECIRCGECVKACPVGAIEKKIAWTR